MRGLGFRWRAGGRDFAGAGFLRCAGVVWGFLLEGLELAVWRCLLDMVMVTSSHIASIYFHAHPVERNSLASLCLCDFASTSFRISSFDLRDLREFDVISPWFAAGPSPSPPFKPNADHIRPAMKEINCSERRSPGEQG